MKSPAYNEALDYALEVLRAIRESGYEMDYPLEQFLKVSINIGASLARAETPGDHKGMLDAYNEANMDTYRSLYWSEILSRIDDYNRIPFDALRKKCEDLQIMLHDGQKLIGSLTGKRYFRVSIKLFLKPKPYYISKVPKLEYSELAYG